MPYVRAAAWRAINLDLSLRAARIRELEAEVARNRAALAGRLHVELERLGAGVLFHFHEKAGERWHITGPVRLED